MDAEKAAFAFYREMKQVIGWGDIALIVSGDRQFPGREMAVIECRFNSSRGQLAVRVELDMLELMRMSDEGVMYRARAEGERILMQLQDKNVGMMAQSRDRVGA